MIRYVQILSLVFAVQIIQAQSVGINTETPDTTAALEIESTSKGLLIPRLKTAGREGIQNPARGLLVYDINTESFWYFDSAWIEISNEDKNVWFKQKTVNAAEVGDTSIYYMGNVAIGIDSSISKVGIYSEDLTPMIIHLNVQNGFLDAGALINIDSDTANQVMGLRTIIQGNATTKTGRSLSVQSSDSLTVNAYGTSNDLYFSPLLTDSVERTTLGVYNFMRAYHNNYQAGIYNRLSGSSYGRQRGTLNNLDISGNGEQIGTYNFFDNDQGEGEHIGTKNLVRGGGVLYGAYHVIQSSNDSTHFGQCAELDGSGNGTRYGTYHKISGSGDGDHYGLVSTLNVAGAGSKKGQLVDIIADTLGGLNMGNDIRIDGHGFKIGTRHIFPSTSGSGSQSGIQNFLYGDINEIKTGVLTQINGDGDGICYGIRNLINTSGNGMHYGTYNDLEYSGGTNVAGYFNSPDFAAIFNKGHVVVNEMGHHASDFRVESFTDTAMLFVDATGNAVGIGTASPDQTLSVIGTTRAALEDAETNYIEFGHGGNNAFINADGTGNIDLRHHDANIMTLASNLRVGIRTNNPSSDLHIKHANSGASGGLRLENTSSGDFARLYVSSSDGNLRIYSDDQAGAIGFFDDASGAYTASSDYRLKEHIESLHFDWDSFMDLAPLVYEFKSDTSNRKHIGMVAQDVQDIYPEAVRHDPEDDVYHMDYAAFGVIAIKAIQEQQKVIGVLRAELKSSTDRMNQLQNQIDELRRAFSTNPDY